ncbi:hypothetical protein HY932_01395 [Candidatus Falkowbacteria bacterium]|nr:hypothetical protein [Candidatus Falkowbacteria bacterium]
MAKTLAASIVMLAVAMIVYPWIANFNLVGFVGALVNLIIVSTLASAAFILIAFLVKSEELNSFYRKLRQRRAN